VPRRGQGGKDRTGGWLTMVCWVRIVLRLAVSAVTIRDQRNQVIDRYASTRPISARWRRPHGRPTIRSGLLAIVAPRPCAISHAGSSAPARGGDAFEPAPTLLKSAGLWRAEQTGGRHASDVANWRPAEADRDSRQPAAQRRRASSL
jgi:hypothetical protein